MGSLFKTPSYSPPAEMGKAEEALAKREAAAEAAEKREKRQLAAKGRTRRMGGRLLFSQDRVVPQLGVQNGMSPVTSYLRQPYETKRMV